MTTPSPSRSASPQKQSAQQLSRPPNNDQPSCSSSAKRRAHFPADNQPDPKRPSTIPAPAPGPKQPYSDNYAKRGAYKTYYHRRAGDTSADNDDRLPVLKQVLANLDTPRILDIGCNNGSLTIHVARHAPSHVVGIDVDPSLIKRARGLIRDQVVTAQKDDRKRCNPSNKQPTPSSPVPSKPPSDKADVFPYNVTFRREDLVKRDGITHKENHKYDLILCLSVTKWVHFAHGDDGLKQFFATIHKCLKDDGCLILEPQLKRSYKLARKRGQIPGNMTFDNFKFKPDGFKDYLLTKGGFSRMDMLRDVRAKGHAFNRPIMAFYKQPTSKETSPPASASASDHTNCATKPAAAQQAAKPLASTP